MSDGFMMGDKDTAVSVPFSDDETETDEKDLFGEAPASASPEERITRVKKQEERVKRILSEGKQSKEEVARLREEQAELKRELAEIRTQRAQPAAQPSDGKNRYQRELDAVYEMQQNAYTAAQAELKAGQLTPERSRYYEGVARDIESRKAAIHTQEALEGHSHRMRAEQARGTWENEYPEVYSNARAYQYAEAKFRQKQAELDPGAPLTNDMVDEAMEEARTRFKLGPKRAPSVSERSKHTGVAASGSGGSSGGGNTIQMTPELRRMAIAAYSELPENEAIKKWAATSGKRLRERKIL